MKKIYVLILKNKNGENEIVYANTSKKEAEKDLERVKSINLSNNIDYKLEEINLYTTKELNTL